MTTGRDSLMRAVCLLSGSGTNLQAILDNISAKKIKLAMTSVISDNPIAMGLERARSSGIKTGVIDYESYAKKEGYHAALKEYVANENPDLIILAGYMRILSDDFCNAFKGSILNIHPSLLPKYKGLNTHQRVINEGEIYHGSSVHFVIPELDEGPCIIQYRLKINPADDAESLKNRVQKGEYKIYSEAISHFISGTIKMENDKIMYKEGHLVKPILIEET